MNMENYIENNKVTIGGTVASEPEFSHEVYEETFYTFMLNTPRLSETHDVIKITISEKFLVNERLCIGDCVTINGQFRSYNRHEEKKNRLILSVFAREVELVDEIEESAKSNQIYLDGFICKEPIYRKTPLGREIADLLIAVNRPYGKSDYIPCICWGRNARFANNFEVGTRCAIWGRIQSREYMKKLSEEQAEKRVAYEVSVNKLDLVEEETELYV